MNKEKLLKQARKEGSLFDPSEKKAQGRPVIAPGKGKNIKTNVYTVQNQIDLIKAAAEHQGVTLSAFFRSAALKEARRIKKEE